MSIWLQREIQEVRNEITLLRQELESRDARIAALKSEIDGIGQMVRSMRETSGLPDTPIEVPPMPRAAAKELGRV